MDIISFYSDFYNVSYSNLLSNNLHTQELNTKNNNECQNVSNVHCIIPTIPIILIWFRIDNTVYCKYKVCLWESFLQKFTWLLAELSIIYLSYGAKTDT